MDFKPVFQKIKEFVNKLNEAGVPAPMLRDPSTGKGSVTLTMTVISFNTALLGQIGKITNFLGSVDLTQANYLFLICLGAYLGRRMQSDAGKKTTTLEAPEEAKDEKQG